MTKYWNSRYMWTGEIPAASDTDLNPVALLRGDLKSGMTYADAVSSSRGWTYVAAEGSTAQASGPMGWAMLMNSIDPTTQKQRMTLPHFSGLWPSAGRLLVGMWVKNSFSMSFTPLISTRGGSSPLVYLSSASSQRPRHQVYGSGGEIVLDQYETVDWQASGEWIWYSMLLDFDGLTSQLGSASDGPVGVGGQHFLGPVRNLTGTPNLSSTADVDVFGLQNSNYWTSGYGDEVLIAHPTANFDYEAFLARVARGTWSQGQDGDRRTKYTVTDSAIKATVADTLGTGAEHVAWTRQPVITKASNVTGRQSFDNGLTWSDFPTTPPATFDGLLKWAIPLAAGASFSGIDITVPAIPEPTISSIDDVDMEQAEEAVTSFTYTVDPQASPGTITVSQSTSITRVTRIGTTLTIRSGFAVGEDIITVTVTDTEGQTATTSFTASVSPSTAPPNNPPKYPFAPIVLWDDDEPWDIVPEPLTGIVTSEVDGEETFVFSYWANDQRVNAVVKDERKVTVAGTTYKVRRLTSKHSGADLITEVYCEALWYDLATAGQISGREWTQVTAGDVMTVALAGTGWTVGTANVTTLRTYTTEDMNPLELLREVQKQHGGELIFDTENFTVSLLTSAGRDQGVTFFYGFALASASRVIDTTSLITRLYAQNADGQTIAPVNNGVPYVENYDYTTDVKIAVYDFAAGTSPYTMLSMANATLAARSKPDYSYECEVADLSADSGNPIDSFELRDKVRVVDEDLDLNEVQVIKHMEYDVVEPWNSTITLSGKLREASSSETTDAGVVTTGTGATTFDLVPFNLLYNGRFDNQMAHWARSGVVVEETNQGTSTYSAVFQGTGERWIEQTVEVDARDGFTFSMDIESEGGPNGWEPDVTVSAHIVFEDGSTDDIDLELS